jgi:hypothetical protein
MTTIYKIFNPTTGEYATAETVDACAEVLADAAMYLLNNFTHNSPYSVVDINEDGSQVWRNPQGEEIVNLEELTAKLKLKIGKQLTSIPVTPVETMP